MKTYTLYKSLFILTVILLMAVFINPAFYGLLLLAGVFLGLAYDFFNDTGIPNPTILEVTAHQKDWLGSSFKEYKAYKPFMTKYEQEQWLRCIIFDTNNTNLHKLKSEIDLRNKSFVE